jgi:hypothetical protein
VHFRVACSSNPACRLPPVSNCSVAGNFGNAALTAKFSEGGQESVPQRDADLLHLWTVFERAAPGGAKAKALKQLQIETSKRAKVDGVVRDAVKHLLSQPAVLSILKAHPHPSSPWSPTISLSPCLLSSRKDPCPGWWYEEVPSPHPTTRKLPHTGVAPFSSALAGS